MAHESRTSSRATAAAVLIGALAGVAAPATAMAAAVCPYWGNDVAGTSGTFYNVSVTSVGGPLITSPKVVLMFWGSYWNTNATVQSRFAHQAGFLNTQAFWNLLNEYGGPRNAAVTTVNTSTNDSLNGNTAINDTHLQMLLRNGVSATVDAQTLYVIILPPGVTVFVGNQTASGGVGYHSNITTTLGAPIYYAVVTSASATSNIGSTLSHEVAEAVTDPVNPGGYDDWDNFGGEGEIGDLCNQYVEQLGEFTIQAIWSQQACRCIGHRNPTTTDVLGWGYTMPAVYRSGTWFILGDYQGLGTNGFNWGGPGLLPVPGDYNGDGQSDMAYYTPSSGTWNITFTKAKQGLTTGQSSTVRSFGAAGAKPVPGDYAGNGVTLPAYWDKNGLVWAVQNGNATSRYPIPATYRNQHPVPGDYDGDLKTDPAFWNPTTGVWSALSSASNYTSWLTYTFGGGADGPAGASDIPIPADFDGDGFIDIAVFRPYDASQGSGAFRYYSFYTNAPIVTPLGGTGDIPVRGDFDGDFFDDYIVYHPSSGTWDWRSAATSAWGWTTQWGISTDTPLTPYP